MTLTEMREILTSGRIQLTKSLGQNFLHDIGQLRKIVGLAELRVTDNVLEIGPGLGPLTELLLERAGKVLAIEKDRRLFEFLRERHKDAANLELIQADALDFIRAKPRDWTDWKLVANLPYSVASPILVELALTPKPPERLVATLQQEVAERIFSQASETEYGVLTLLLQLRYEPRDSFKISSSSFFPAPNVDSACILLTRRTVELLPAECVNSFVRIVKRAFSQRRKMMLKLLKADWPLDILAKAFVVAGISPQARGEACSLEQFVILTKHLSLSKASAQMNDEIFDVVDDRDEVIGQAMRAEVHRTGLKHRAVHVMIFNARGEIFLQKRSLKKDTFPGAWDSSSAGHLDRGESYDACALREVWEELGITLTDIPRPIIKIDACPQTGQEFVWVYETRHEGPFTLHPEEIEGGDWFAPARINKWIAERPQDFLALVLVDLG